MSQSVIPVPDREVHPGNKRAYCQIIKLLPLLTDAQLNCLKLHQIGMVQRRLMQVPITLPKDGRVVGEEDL